MNSIKFFRFGLLWPFSLTSPIIPFRNIHGFPIRSSKYSISHVLLSSYRRIPHFSYIASNEILGINMILSRAHHHATYRRRSLTLTTNFIIHHKQMTVFELEVFVAFYFWDFVKRITPVVCSLKNRNRYTMWQVCCVIFL